MGKLICAFEYAIYVHLQSIALITGNNNNNNDDINTMYTHMLHLYGRIHGIILLAGLSGPRPDTSVTTHPLIHAIMIIRVYMEVRLGLSDS